MTQSIPQLPPVLENDCEDVGYTNISHGCIKCQYWSNGKTVRPEIKDRGDGNLCCVSCGGCYGFAAPGVPDDVQRKIVLNTLSIACREIASDLRNHSGLRHAAGFIHDALPALSQPMGVAGIPPGMALDTNEIQALLDILKLDHDGSDFEVECPNCTAYQKLTAMLAGPCRQDFGDSEKQSDLSLKSQPPAGQQDRGEAPKRELKAGDRLLFDPLPEVKSVGGDAVAQGASPPKKVPVGDWISISAELPPLGEEIWAQLDCPSGANYERHEMVCTAERDKTRNRAIASFDFWSGTGWGIIINWKRLGTPIQGVDHG
jgi:hypothetical protein